MGGGTGQSSTMGTPGGGTAPGSGGSGAQQSQGPTPPFQSEGQQARVPDLCSGADCTGNSEPTGNLGDRGLSATGRQPPYDASQSPVPGGPSFESPTGRPLNLPQEGNRQ